MTSKNVWNKNKKGYKNKYPKIRKKIKLSDEHKEKIKESIKSHWNKRDRKMSDIVKEKIRKTSIGKIVSEKTRSKISESKKGKAVFFGENHPNWKGGLSFQPYSIDWTDTLKRSIRERDHYVCQECSAIQNNIAHDVHHIDYDKNNCNPNNLITLCHSCHTKTNYNREFWINHFCIIKKIC